MKNAKQYYFEKFKGATFVMKMGGEVIFDAEKLESLFTDIATLHQHDIRIIIVHGGGPQADDLSRTMGFEPTKIEGRRVTTEQDMEVVQMLYGGKLNLKILSILKKVGIKGMRVSGVDAHLLEVIKRPVKDVDYGLVGDIQSVHPEMLLHLIEQNIVPVISPVAATAEGEMLNINADTIACRVASEIKADKLIYFTNTDGVFDENGERISFLTPQEVQESIDQGIIQGGMKVKTQNGIEALEAGVKRVHVLDGLNEHSLLLEVLSSKGSGTMLCTEEQKEEHLKEMTL